MTTQLTLPFEDDPHEQRANLARVRGRIGAAVLAFVRERLESGSPEFVIAELHRYVQGKVPGAPASPDRILRLLKQEGKLDYEVVSRKGSRYKALSVTETRAA